MKKLLLALLISLLVLISCQERFNGKNEQLFKISKEKIKKKLNQTEKTNLENAFQIIGLEAYRIRNVEPDKHEAKPYKDIAFEMIDGQTYSSVLDLAENILKNNNKRSIKYRLEKINNLNHKKTEIETIQKQLNLFKVSSVKIYEDKWFNKIVPKIEIEYQYLGEDKLLGKMSISYRVTKISTNELICSEGYLYRDFFYKKGKKGKKRISLISDKHSLNMEFKEKFKNKYPIENANLADYDLELNIIVKRLVIDGKEIKIPETTISEIDIEIKTNQKKLEHLKSVKAPFFELELTNTLK